MKPMILYMKLKVSTILGNSEALTITRAKILLCNIWGTCPVLRLRPVSKNSKSVEMTISVHQILKFLNVHYHYARVHPHNNTLIYEKVDKHYEIMKGYARPDYQIKSIST